MLVVVLMVLAANAAAFTPTSHSLDQLRPTLDLMDRISMSWSRDAAGKLELDNIHDLLLAGPWIVASAAVQQHGIGIKYDIYESKLLTWSQILAMTPRIQQWIEPADIIISTDVFAFIPVLAANFYPHSTPIMWETSCSKQNMGSVDVWNATHVQIIIEITPSNHSLCQQQLYFWLGLSDQGGFSKFEYWNESLTVTFVHQWSSMNEEKRSARSGLGLLYFPTGSIEGLVLSVARTANLILNDNFDEDWQSSTVKWLQKIGPQMFGGFRKRNSNNTAPILLSEKDIPDGTHLVIYRLDGQEAIADWAVGSESGHHTIAFRDPIDNKLYVYESTDEMPGSDPYWPPPYGVCRRPWSVWIEQAVKAQFNVVLLPLKEEHRSKFNNTAAQVFWEDQRGLPYGYHEYLWEWVDAGNLNLPWNPHDQGQSLSMIFEGMENYLGNTSKIGAWSMLIQAVNARLDQNFFSMAEMYNYFMDVDKRDDVYQRLLEVVSEPEQDSYNYWNHPNVCNQTIRPHDCTGRSMICEVFVFSILKHAGIFDDVTFQASEVDPRSAYLADIWDTSYMWPDKRCQQQVNETGFCQIIGKWSTPLVGVGTVPVTSNFAGKCQDYPPKYARLPAIC